MDFELPKTFAQGRFQIDEVLGAGSMGIVYKAMDREQNLEVALKTLLHIDSDNLYYFKNEFRSLHDLAHPNLCSLMELIQDGNIWFLTMELIDGLDFIEYVSNSVPSIEAENRGVIVEKALDQESSQKEPISSEKISPKPFDEKRLRRCLSGLCQGLIALHSAGKVHRDVKPSNVRVTEEGRAVLLDFGVVADKKIPERSDIQDIAGTILYMAPEQIDAYSIGPESDWYAVGVMLYQALTGVVPFNGCPSEILIAKQLTDPIKPRHINPVVPEDLENLCLSLLSRDPRSRPSVSEIIEAVELSERDTYSPSTSAYTQTNKEDLFIGRKEELELLRQSYQRTVSDRVFETVVIEGVSGVGKSTLVDHFVHEILSINPLAIILKGRCYERESAPYKAFDGLIESLVRYISLIPPEDALALELDPYKNDLLTLLFPTLKRSDLFAIIPAKKIVIEDPRELQNKAFDSLKEVLNRLSLKQPLVIIIDDMQWVDADSLMLLKHLANSCEDIPLFLIYASRFVKDAEGSGVDWNSITSQSNVFISLNALDATDSEQLAHELLNLANISTQVSPKAIATEAAGHPLYIAELVQHISFGAKEWKSLRLDEVILNRVQKMPPLNRLLLENICVAGTPIQREHLQRLTNLSSEDFFKGISFLRALKLVRSRGPRKNHLIEPYHDRVREAVVAHASATGHSMHINLKIGRFFLQIYSEDELEENMFSVVRHLDAGRDLIKDETQKLRLAELYYLAGKKARESAAYESSLTFFRKSIELFPVESWGRSYDTMFALYSAAAEAAYIAGDFSLAMEWVNEAKGKAKSNIDRAKIYETYILSLVADGNSDEAIDEALGMFKQLGVTFPPRPGKMRVLANILSTKILLSGTTKEQLLALPKLKNRSVATICRLINRISDIVYLNRPNLRVIMIAKTVELSLKYGIDHNSVSAFVIWGFLNCGVLKNYAEGYKYGRISFDLSNQLENSSNRAIVLFLYATFVQHHKEHIGATLPCLSQSHETADKTGDLPYLAWSGTVYCYHLFLSGEPLPHLIPHFVRYTKEMHNKKQDLQYNMICMFHQVVLNFMGQCSHPVNLEGEVYRETEMVSQHIEKNHRNSLSGYHFCKLMLCVYFDAPPEAHRAALDLDRVADAATATFRSALAPFYDSLACLKYHHIAEPTLSKKLLNRVRANQQKYKKLATYSPANHLHKYQIIEAERAALAGKTKAAEELYGEAIAGALEHKFIHDAALACELAANYYAKMRESARSQEYAKEALSHYEKWGALAKSRDIKKRFGV